MDRVIDLTELLEKAAREGKTVIDSPIGEIRAVPVGGYARPEVQPCPVCGKMFNVLTDFHPCLDEGFGLGDITGDHFYAEREARREREATLGDTTGDINNGADTYGPNNYWDD